MTWRWLGIVAAGVLIGAAPVAAQTVVTGTIRSAGRPLAGAEARLEPGGISATTGPDGSYTLAAGGGGVVHLSVRALGYYPAGKRMLLVADDSIRIDFALDPVPQELDSLTVRAAGPSATGMMAAFEERRRVGIGRFITRDMLAQREGGTTADVLRMTAGVRLFRRPDACGGGFAIGTGRGGVSRSAPWLKCGPRGVVPMEPACYFTIFLDGVLFWRPGGRREPPDVNQFGVHSLQGAEIYRGPSEVPIQYQGTDTDCGVMLLWTRTGP